VFSKIKDWFKATWQKIKDWSGWSSAGTIFFSRMEGVLAFVGAAVAGIDWNALLALDFTQGFKNPALWVGAAVIVLRSVAYEWTRRHNATDI